MLGRVLELWRGKSLISQMLDEFAEMLGLSKSMFDTLVEIGLNGGDLETIREDFFAKDTAINQLEQSIRRKIVVHLSVQTGTDVPVCLVLMSVAKDAERLGDYAKNVFEVFENVPRLEPGLYHDQLLRLSSEISAAFSSVAGAFRSSDVQAARQLKESNYRLEKQCDAVVNELLGGAKSEAAVAYVLLFRFFKRILGHLSNIISSVVMPVDKIDYFDEPGKSPEGTSNPPE
jgi:phosphate uptake regulator